MIMFPVLLSAYGPARAARRGAGLTVARTAAAAAAGVVIRRTRAHSRRR
jgi:hypothetical protein